MGTPTLTTWPDPGPFWRAPQTLWGKTGLGDFSFILFCLSRLYFRESTCAHVRAEKGQGERVASRPLAEHGARSRDREELDCSQNQESEAKPAHPPRHPRLFF